MIRLVTITSLAVVMASGLATVASAATLSGVSGRVLVDSGRGFVKAAAGSEVKPGSRILVAKDGKAVLAYADGCSKTLGASSITAVVDKGACQQVAQVASQSTPPPAINPWLLGGAGAAGGAVLGYAIGQNVSNDDVVYLPISR